MFVEGSGMNEAVRLEERLEMGCYDGLFVAIINVL